MNRSAVLMAVRAAVGSLLCLALAACGSGAVESPGPDDDDGFTGGRNGQGQVPGNGGGGGGGGDNGEEFSFRLPTGPVGPTTDQDPVRDALAQGCASAQPELERSGRLRAEPGTEQHKGGLLYLAAIQICRGDRASALQTYNQIGMPLWQQACLWYRAIGSYLFQQHPDTVPCDDDSFEGPDPQNGGDGDGSGTGVEATSDPSGQAENGDDPGQN